MAKFDLKFWGIRVRKALIVTLIAPFFTVISAVAPQLASAAFQSANDGSCTQDVGSTTGVTVTTSGRDCIVSFTDTSVNSWVVPSSGTNFQILVVGGGGGAGADGGNGGGGGELRYSSASPTWIPAAGTTVSIQVGAGGAGGYSSTNGSASTVAWGGSTRFQANGGTRGGGWQSVAVPAGGTGGTGGTGTNGQTATATPPNSACSASLSATQQPSSGNWFSTRWFMNGGGGAGGALTTTAPSNDITGSSKFYGGAGGAGWGSSVNSASVGPIFGLAGGGTVNNTSTSGGRGANWQYEAGESTTYRRGASVGANGVNGTGGGGGGGNACDPTINGSAITNLEFKRTAGGNGGSGVVTIRYTTIFTVSFDANGGSGSPSISSASQTLASSTVTLANVGTLARNGYTFTGWNTQSNGLGVNYAAGSTFTPSSNVTLFAQWRSTIQYDPNTATSTRAIESTTALGSSSTTTLSNGKLVSGSIITNGLTLNLNAADSSSVTSTQWLDRSSSNTPATMAGSPTYDPVDGSFRLNGSSQYFNLGTSALSYSGTQKYTLNIMFKSDTPMKFSCLVCRYAAGGSRSFMLISDTEQITVHREVSPWSKKSTTRYNPGDINYATMVYDGTRMISYLNGVEVARQNSGTEPTSTTETFIGAGKSSGSPTDHFQGRIYSVQAYNRDLSPTEIQANYQALLPGQKVAKNNFTLLPWNTSSAGTGTAIGSTVTDLGALPAPYMRLQPDNYTQATKTWTNTPGSSAFTYRGTPERIASNNGKFGATGNFPVIGGTTSDGFNLGNPTLTTYTLCVVARYRGLAASPGTAASQGRLIGGKTNADNWISGYHNANVSEFHHTNGYNLDSTVTDLNWHYHCDSGNRAWWDGTKIASWTNQVTTSMPTLAINNWDSGQYSDWELAELIIYDQYLPDSQIEQINRYFRNTYGILAGPTTMAAAVSVAPSTTYASTGDTTLFANWGSAITYDGNKQTSGSTPSPTLITGASGALASNSGTLVRAGFRFDGWNTNESGTGTTYAAGGTYPNTGNVTLYAKWTLRTTFPTSTSVIEPNNLLPYMRYKASDYDATAKTWRDSSGNARNVSLINGSPSVVTTTANTNGSSKAIQVLQGVTTDRITFDNPTTTGGRYTLFSLVRYNSALSAKQERILNSVDNTWFTGHHGDKAGVSYHEGTWLKSTSTVTPVTNWVLGTDYTSSYRSNGNQITVASNGGANLRRLGINTYVAEASDFQIAEIILYDRALTLAEIRQVEEYLAFTYGIAAYSLTGTYSTSSSLAIGAGVGGRSETLTATNGLGNKTITMSPTRSGITLETTTANSANVVVSPTAATGVYVQTITATDTTGEAVTHTLTITVSPSVKFDTSTATALITTHRRGASLRLNTVFGVGTKIFTMTSAGTGITLDTSTAAASGFATLRVDTFTAAGTYTQLITVTDDTRIRSTYTVTITINGPPTLSSTSAIVTSPILDSLRLNLDAGDQASYSGSGTTWTDLSGNSRNGSLISSPPFSSANGGILNFNGTSQYVTTPSVRSEVFTVEAWVRFNALNNNYACVVTNQYSANKINYSICFWGNSTIRAGYHQAGTGWIGGQTGAFTPVVGTWYQLVYKVEKIGTNYIGSLFQNGNLVAGQTTSTIAPNNDQLVDRIGVGWNSGVFINGSIPVVRIYNRALSTAEITQNYNAVLPRFSNNPTNSVTITTTESVTASSSIYYAGLGTGNKTFTLSNPTVGLSIDTSTVNTVRLNAANTLTATSTTVARSISQVITATDTTGVAATTPVYLTTVINPRVIITDATPGTLSTTFGRIAYDTFTATQGTGAKTFTVSSASFPSAFIMTNPSSNVGLLTVGNTLPAGTYPVTVTATDSVGGITTLALSVVVNPAPTIAGATGNSVTTTLARSTSLRINVVGGTGARTISWTSPNAGITIDSSTITSQNFITLNVSAAVPAATYSFAIAAVDSLSVRVSDTFTVIVNRWPVIGTKTAVNSNLRISLDAGNASSYSGSGNTWTDLSGNGRNGTWQQSPTFKSASGGSLAMGSSSSQYMSTSGLGATNVFTAETWAKFNVIPANDNCIVSDRYTTSFINYSICFRNDGKIYGGYWNGTNGWVSSAGTATPLINTWYHFAYTVSLSGSTYTSILYQNGVAVGSPVTSTVAPNSSNLGLLVGTNWRADTKVVNGDIAIVRIYNRALTRDEIVQNFNAQGDRFTSTNSGSDSATVTQGIAGSITNVSAIQGTGAKSFALSATSSGIALSNATSNTFTLTLPDTLTALSATTARILTETVTATDQAGATTARVYSITVNPPIRVESTTSIVRTTSGIVAWDTFTATLGTGNKTFTLAGTPDINGFTLTQSNNQAVLRVGSTVNPGTYTLTITATDAVGAVTTLTKTVVVNTLPTISGNPSVTGTRGYTFNSPTYGASGGTGNLTFSISTSPAIPGGIVSGIKLSATTGTPSIIVESTTAADTYTVTLRVTDSLTAFSTFVVTIRVNPPVTLTGTLSLTKVYGEDLSQVYTTGGGTAPFRIFASTICTSEKSSYVGNGTNGTLGVTYTVETFNGVGSCNWTVPKDVSNVSVLTVAGGGGGGGTAWAGGGGAGGVVFANSVTVTPAAVIPIVVGAGGAGGQNNDSCVSGSSPSQGSNGNNSSFNSTFTAVGGGGGGGYGWSNRAGCGSGKSGGSGGGSGETDYNPLRATSTQGTFSGAVSSGNSGGITTFLGGIQAGSGGGGAGGIGSSTAGSRNHVAGNGGAGIANAITGTSTFYGGGGGGATCISGCTAGAAVGLGGSGGGGNGGHGGAAPANGINGLGGGGGGSQTGVGANGGSGTVIVRYISPAVDTETTRITLDTLSVTPVGSLRLNAPRNLPVGSYSQTITVIDSAGTPATTSATISLSVIKATPTLTLALPGSATTAKYGNPVTISAIATTPGTVAFVNGSSNITACTAVTTTAGLASCSWTPTVVGSTTLRATLTPTDTANYNSSAQVNLPITVAKADTLTVTVASLTRQYTGSAVTVTGAFTTTGLVDIDTLTAISMLYSGTANTGTSRSATTAPTDAGIYTIAPNFPANASAYTFGIGSLGTTSSLSNYESVTVVAGTLTVNRQAQLMTFTYANSNTVAYSPTATISSTATSRRGSGAKSYTSSTPAKCSIASTAVVSVLEAGTCTVNMIVAETANFAADTATATITINKASRTFSLTPAVSTLKYADTTTVTATLSAGALDGTISYTLGSPAGCTFDPLSGELLAISGTIQCPLTATISEGINYLAETTTAISLTIAPADAPVITIETITALSHTPGVRALIAPTFTIAGLKNTDTANSLTYTYSFISNPFETFTYSDTRTPIDAGTYRITPSALTLSSGLLSNYETPTYSASAIDFVINRIAQETVTIQSVNSEVEVPFTLIATGGSTSGVITFAKVSGTFCSISGKTLTATQAGSCMVTVTRAGNRNYLDFTSESVTVRVRNFVIVQIVVPENPITGITIAPSVPLTKGPDACTSGCVPRITGADVYDVAEGDLIVLTGVSFTGVTKVYFNIYTEAPNFNVDSDTQISVRVPADLPLGDATIEVVSPGGTSNRLFDFIILP